MPNIRKIKLGRLTRVDLAFLHFKVALAALLFGAYLQSPSFRGSIGGIMLLVWIVMCMAGLIVSVYGLLLGAQTETVRHKGFRWELVGLWLLLGGTAAFMLVQLGLALTPGAKNWSLVGIFFPWVISAAIMARMAMVRSAERTVLYTFPQKEPLA